jgi:hypothetical protein
VFEKATVPLKRRQLLVRILEYSAVLSNVASIGDKNSQGRGLDTLIGKESL